MDFTFNITPINKEYILSNINQETIFNHYLGLPVESKKLFVNPLRNDHKPTAAFYKSKSGIVYFHDFATNIHYNCFTVVMNIYNCDYHKALKIIAKDFGLIDNKDIQVKKIKVVKELDVKSETFLQAEIQKFSKFDLEWWGKFGVSIKELKKYKVYSVKNVFLNGNIFATYSERCPIYGYYGGNDKDLEYWRMYFPTRKSYRFLANWKKDKIQGFKQLPKSGKVLVCTKSMKDVMCLNSYKIPAIAPCSENLFINDKILNNLKERFKYIIVFYDNDRAGKYNLSKIRKDHPELKYFFIPTKYKAKDISDFYKKYGRIKTWNFIKQELLKLNDNT